MSYRVLREIEPVLDVSRATAVVGSLLLRSTVQGQEEVVCLRKTAVILGTAEKDSIKGTEGDDVINGLAGDDVIDGLGGVDLICGAGGDDTIRGGDGDDSLAGRSNDDHLTGGEGFDGADGGPHHRSDICNAEVETTCER